MSTWRPPWLAPGQFKLTLLPATRASNSVTARPAPGPGSTAALRAGSPDPGTPRPARRSGLAGRVPDRRRPRRPRWGRALGATPSQPSPNHRPQHHTSGGPGQASPDPTRPHQADRRVRRGRAAFALLGWGTIQAWLCRCAMADAAPPAPDRWCAPSATTEPAPRTAAPPALPVQPRSALRDPPRVGSAGGDSAAHPPARPRSWVTTQVGCWESWPGWSWLDCWEEGLCHKSS
jgi:hypothetical protein